MGTDATRLSILTPTYNRLCGVEKVLTLESSTVGGVQPYSTRMPTRLPGDQHPNLELILVLEGTATYQLDERTRQLDAATSLWVAPNHPHKLITASPDYLAWIAVFIPPLVDRVAASFSPTGLRESVTQGAVFRRLPEPAVDRLKSLFEDLHSGEASPAQDASGGPMVTPASAALSYLLVSAWAEQAYADGEDSADLDLHPAVEKAAQLLKTKGGNITLEELAKVCGASSAWLSRLFRQQMGISLVDYRNQHRIERFFELYRNGHRLNITQAALEAGFGSYAQFHRVFRKRVGYGPAELRRRLATAR